MCYRSDQHRRGKKRCVSRTNVPGHHPALSTLAVSSRRAGRSAALGELLPPMAPFGLTLAAPRTGQHGTAKGGHPGILSTFPTDPGSCSTSPGEHLQVVRAGQVSAQRTSRPARPGPCRSASLPRFRSERFGGMTLRTIEHNQSHSDQSRDKCCGQHQFRRPATPPTQGSTFAPRNGPLAQLTEVHA